MIKQAISKTKLMFVIEFVVILLSIGTLVYVDSSKILPFVCSSLFSSLNLFLIILFVHGLLNVQGAVKGVLVFISMIKYLFIGLGVYLLIKYFRQDYFWVILGFSTIFVSIIFYTILKFTLNSNVLQSLKKGI